MMKVIDCRNLACPAPVVKVRQVLELGGEETFCVMLDNGPARENVTRFALERGCAVHAEEQSDCAVLTLTPSKNKLAPQGVDGNIKNTVILISSDRLGTGPEELGKLLLKNFIITVLELSPPPTVIFFINSGVFITTEGSELLEPLSKLAALGVKIYSCGICLEYFGLKDKLAAGGVTNMFTIVETLDKSANVITL